MTRRSQEFDPGFGYFFPPVRAGGLFAGLRTIEEPSVAIVSLASRPLSVTRSNSFWFPRPPISLAASILSPGGEDLIPSFLVTLAFFPVGSVSSRFLVIVADPSSGREVELLAGPKPPAAARAEGPDAADGPFTSPIRCLAALGRLPPL